MIKFLKKILGIDALEVRIAKLEANSQTAVNSEDEPYDDVLDEWMNGKREGER